MVSTIVVELPSSDEEEEKVPEVKPKASKGMSCSIWQYGLWSFQTGGTKLGRLLPKNQHTQGKLLNFENWISGGLRSFQKSEF